MVIYLDVLVLINLYVTYFQILAVSVLTHRKIIWYRKLISAGIGGAASLSIFIPQDMVITLTMLKIALCFIITLTAFGYGGFLKYMKSVLDVCEFFVFRSYAVCMAVCRSDENAFYKRYCVFRYRYNDGYFMHLCRLYGNEDNKVHT